MLLPLHHISSHCGGLLELRVIDMPRFAAVLTAPRVEAGIVLPLALLRWKSIRTMGAEPGAVRVQES